MLLRRFTEHVKTQNWTAVAADGRPITGELDLAALCRNQELRNAVVEMIDIQHDWDTMAEGVRTRIADMQQRLEQNGNGHEL